ncbi:MAG: hypothetical protein JRJ84_09660, partial [Deltaproteobacteria bacterium]|nr:hypothetical protein [Deltaproteobacteria bacterium]
FHPGDTEGRRERRGVAIALSPEWLQATATGILVLLAAWWLLKGQGALWRRWVWAEAGGAVRETAASIRGEVRSRWTGYSVEAPGVRVHWGGGLRGAWTRVRAGGTKEQWEGLLDAEAVRKRLETLRSSDEDV